MIIVNKLRITSSVVIDDVILCHMNWVKKDILHYPNVEVEWVKRKKQTIKQMFQLDNTPLIVIEHTGPKLYFSPNDKIFYHENTSKVKLKNIEKHNQLPPLISCINKDKIDSFEYVDCTTGLGNDLSLVANYFKSATIKAFEKDIYTHLIVKWGIYFYDKDLYERIQFIYGSIQESDINVFDADIIYLDPFYEDTIDVSNINVLVNHVRTDGYKKQNDALMSYLMQNIRHKLILRGHYQSDLFIKYPFERLIQKRSKTHYGVINKKRMHKHPLFSNTH